MWGGGVEFVKNILNGLEDSVNEDPNSYIDETTWLPEWKSKQLEE
jgi:hypothetical protein